MSLRGSLSSFQEQASYKTKVPSVEVPYSLCLPFNLKICVSLPLKVSLFSFGSKFEDSQYLYLGFLFHHIIAAITQASKLLS